MDPTRYLGYIQKLLKEKDQLQVSRSLGRINAVLKQKPMRQEVKNIWCNIDQSLSISNFEGLHDNLTKLKRVLLNISISEVEGQAIIDQIAAEENFNISKQEELQLLAQIKQEIDFERAEQIARNWIYRKKQSDQILVQLQHKAIKAGTDTSSIEYNCSILSLLDPKTYLNTQGFDRTNVQSAIIEIEYTHKKLIASERAVANESTEPLCFVKIHKKEIRSQDIFKMGSTLLNIKEVKFDRIRVEYHKQNEGVINNHIEENIAKIGRTIDCRLKIQDSMVSSNHAEIHKIGARWFLIDSGSINGTWKAFHNGFSLDHRRNSPPIKIKHQSELLVDKSLYRVTVKRI